MPFGKSEKSDFVKGDTSARNKPDRPEDPEEPTQNTASEIAPVARATRMETFRNPDVDIEAAYDQGGEYDMMIDCAIVMFVYLYAVYYHCVYFIIRYFIRHRE